MDVCQFATHVGVHNNSVEFGERAVGDPARRGPGIGIPRRDQVGRLTQDRRPGFPIDNPFVFYPKYAAELVSKTVSLARLYLRFYRKRRQLEKSEAALEYTDAALEPAGDDNLDELQLTTATGAARAAAEKARRRATRSRPAQEQGLA